MMMRAAYNLNPFSVKEGVFKYCSPHVTMKGTPLNYKKHFAISFEACAQAHDDSPIENDNESRTLNEIFLEFTFTHQQGHEIMNLQSEKKITRVKVTSIFMPTTVQLAVKTMTAKQEFDGALIIVDKHRNPILN